METEAAEYFHDECKKHYQEKGLKIRYFIASISDVELCTRWFFRFVNLPNRLEQSVLCTLCSRIDISDNGVGISEEDTAKIFARFYRTSAASEQEGVGLGLYLARKIVASEGGYIKVKSNLQQGSIFSVFLPMKR